VLWYTWEGTRGRKTENSIKLIHAAHAKATQAIEQHIAPGYEAGIILDKNTPIGVDVKTYPVLAKFVQYNIILIESVRSSARNFAVSLIGEPNTD
jgi:hypothetical protein